jgi:hypothetical protein
VSVPTVVKVANSPWTSSAAAGTVTTVENNEPVCLWQSLQWQFAVASGSA